MVRTNARARWVLSRAVRWAAGSAGLAALVGARAARAAPATWFGGFGDWGDASKWDTLAVPQTAADDAVVTNGVVTLETSYAIGALTLSAGNVTTTNGSGLTLAGSFAWSGGALTGSGSTTANGGMTLSGTNAKIIDERTLINGGAATWTAGNIDTSGGAVFVNNGTFSTDFDGEFKRVTGTSTFNNAGVLQKTAGLGGTNATLISTAFNNSGTAAVQAGNLALSGGGSASGSFAVSSGAALQTKGDYTFAAGSTVSGAGNFSFDLGNVTVDGGFAIGGVTTINAGTVTLNSTGTTGDLALVGGLLTGTGTLTAGGAVTWTGTAMQGTGSVVSNGTLVLSGSDHGLNAHTVVNAGSGTWSAGNILFSNNATLQNTGTLENTFAATMFTSGSNSGRFVNSGLFVKSGAGETTINPVAVNTGTVRVTSGVLTLNGGGSASGSFEVGTGTRLKVFNDYAFVGGSRISGSGTVELSGGVNTVGGTYDVTGRTEVFGGLTTFTGTVSNLGSTLYLGFGTVVFDTPLVNANKLEHFGGAMSGAGHVVFHDVVTWEGGAQFGSGTTTATAGMLLQGGDKILNGRTVVNAVGSAATWSAGTMLGFGGTLQNDGTMVNSFDGQFSLAGGGAPQFVNNGLFVKSGGAGATTFGAALVNNGTVRIDSGSIVVGGGAGTGQYNLAAGGMQIFGPYTLGAGAALIGTNTATFSGQINVTGPVSARFVSEGNGGEITGPGNITIEQLTWTAGRMTGTGTTTVTTSLSISGSGKEITGRTLKLMPGAASTWSGGDLSGFPGAVVDNGGTFTNSFDGTFFYASSQSAKFVNSGLFVKSGGTGTTTFNVFFNNSGTTRVNSGALSLAGGGTASGNFDLVGGSLQLNSGYVLQAGATITGTNKVQLLGDVSVGGAVSAKTVEHVAGTTAVGGTFTTENYFWSGGTLGGPGLVVATSTLGLSGNLKTIDGATLRAAGSAVATWTTGDLRAGNGGVLENLGTFNAAGDQQFFYNGGAAPAFNNAGTFAKTLGTGLTAINVPFNNTGLVRVNTGTLSLGGGGSATGQFDLLGGGMEVGGGYAFNGGVTITGTNKAKIVGNVSVNGAVTAKNVEQTAGVLTGAGTLATETYAWKGGTLDGTGTTSVSSSLELSGNDKFLDARVLSLGASASATWSSGNIFGANAGRIENAGLFLNSFDASLLYQTGVVPVFNNTGEFRKTAGSGTTSIGVTFNNSGITRVNSGSLRLNGGSATGNFDVAAGSQLEIAFDYTFNPGATITGAGKTRLLAGVTTVNGTLNAATFEQVGGTLSGSGTLSAGTYTFTGGVMSGSGTTQVNSAMTIAAPEMNLVQRTLSIGASATATWSAGDIRIAQGGTINNAGVLDIAGDVNMIRIDGSNVVLNNSGTLRKSAGTNTTIFPGVALNNTGTVEVNVGTLNPGAIQFDTLTGTLSGGTWKVSGSGKLDLGGGGGVNTNLANVTLDGPAASFPKINDLADNRGTFTLKNGKQFFTGTTFVNSGTVTTDAASGIYFGNVMSNAGNYNAGGTTQANFLFNSGKMTQSGSLSIAVEFQNNGTGTADIAGPQNWGASAHLRVNGGSVILRNDSGSTAAANLTINSTGGLTDLRTSQHLKNLSVDAGLVKLAAGGGKVLRSQSYSPGGTPNNWNGQIDLTDNRMILEYTGESVLSVLENQLHSGYNEAGAHWTGPGVISSAAQGDPTLALGVAEALDILGPSGGTFAGETISGTNAVLVRLTKFGDSNLDGKVNFTDFLRLERGFGKPGHWAQGDFNYDGLVDRADFRMLYVNFGQSLGVPADPVGASQMQTLNTLAGIYQVPEPSGVGLVAAGAVLARRRRRA
jgi:hypothetical protein